MIFDPPGGEDAPSDAKKYQGDEAGRAIDNGFAGVVGDGSQSGHGVSIANFALTVVASSGIVRLGGEISLGYKSRNSLSGIDCRRIDAAR